jgi:hypothetical protein
MKRIVTLLLIVSLSAAVVAQIKPNFKPGKNRNVGQVIKITGQDNLCIGAMQPNETVLSKSALSNVSLMQTVYDVPTNASTSERIYLYPDGTIGACSMMAHDTNFTDRGTGYNYFDGTTWGAMPTTRLESVRTGWSCLAPCGNGEIIAAHWGGHGLVFMKRANKGTGEWTQSVLDPPAGATGFFYPRIVTNGVNHETVHVICLTTDVFSGGTLYNGVDAALLYNRSFDGGVNWEGWRQLDGLDSTHYKHFGGDCSTFAEPRGDTIAFAYGDSYLDFGYLKSTDNGATWTRSLVWQNPHVNYGGPNPADTFYTVDRNVAAALDIHGKLHLVIGLTRVSLDSSGNVIRYLWTDGLLYWNEDMPQWNPVLDPETLYANGNYIGWVQDTNVFNANSQDLNLYFSGMSSQPAMVIDTMNQMFVIWSGVTNDRDLTNHLYRRIFARASTDGGVTWCDTIVPLTTGPDFAFTENVFTSASPTSNDKLHLVFQTDSLAGTHLFTSNGQTNQLTFTTNNVTYLSPSKASILCSNAGIAPEPEPAMQVRLFPNPVQNQGQLHLYMKKSGYVSLEIKDILGQKVISDDQGFLSIGSHQLSIDAAGLTSGIYFYTVYLNKVGHSGKMVVKR